MKTLVVAPYLFKGRPEYDLWKPFFNSDEFDTVDIGTYDQKLFVDNAFMDIYYLKICTAVIEKLQSREHNKILWLEGWNPAIFTVMQHCLIKKDQGKCGHIDHYGFFHGRFLTTPATLDYEKFLVKRFKKVFVTSMSFDNFTDEKLVNIGYPYTPDSRIKFVPTSEKPAVMVYPHRLSKEKGIEDFFKLAEECPSVAYKICTPIEPKIKVPSYIEVILCDNKDRYYEELSKSMFVWSGGAETFGVAIQEAYLSGCIPILNDRKIFREIYGDKVIYDSLDQIPAMLETVNYEDATNKVPVFDMEKLKNEMVM